MKHALMAFVLSALAWPLPCFAARVCVEKSTGKLIEYQSHATPGTLLQNAQAAGLNVAALEERDVTALEWDAIYDAQVVVPARNFQATLKATRQLKADALATKLGLSKQDMDDLRDILQK